MDTRSVSKLIGEVAKTISGIAQGTTITHLSFEEMLGVQYRKDNQKYFNLIGKLNKELQAQYGLFLKNERKVGYSIALPGDEIDLCIGEFNAGKKKMWRAVARTNLIRVDRITDPVKRVRTITEAQKRANLMGLLRAGDNDGDTRAITG